MDGKIKLGFALTGSYCTFSKVLPQIETLIERGMEVFPIMSENAAATDTRFGSAAEYKSKIKATFGVKIPHWTESLKVCMKNLKNL